MQVVLENGTVIRNVSDVLYALKAFNVPDPIIEMIGSMCDREATLERVAQDRRDSDLQNYEASLEAYRSALSDILDIVETGRSKRGDIKHIIENVL